MAKPIKETPFLKGRDAKSFIANNRTVVKATENVKREINDSYKALKDIAEFAI